jgi:hypothetical protein
LIYQTKAIITKKFNPQKKSTMKSKHIFNLTVGLAFGLILVSCGKDSDDPETPPATVNEEELITTVTLEFTDPLGIHPTVFATFRDTDGPGGAEPSQFDTIQLVPSVLYNAHIVLLNESVDPAEDITAEVEEEAVDHLFCYTPEGVDVDIVRTDSDGTYEIGITTAWQTNGAGSGSVKVVLKHQPGIKDGSCAPGETDIEIDFPVVIE